MKTWQIALIIILGTAILIFLILSFVLGFIFYHTSFNRRKGDKDFAKNESEEAKNKPARIWFWKQNIEELNLKSYDHKNLKGYFIKNNASNKIAFLIHGYRGRYYSSVEQAKIFYEAGYSVFLNNHRGHDSSDGRWFTMGVKEKRDILMWLNKLVALYPESKIVLLGVSMGAHIVMMTTGMKGLPTNLKCAIEDCGYASLEQELKENLAKLKTPVNKKYIFFCGKVFAVLFHHHRIHSCTKEALDKCSIPMLFIHGDADTYVPYSCLEENYNNLTTNVYKEKRTFPGCAHNESVYKFPQEYNDTIITFANRFTEDEN